MRHRTFYGVNVLLDVHAKARFILRSLDGAIYLSRFGARDACTILQTTVSIHGLLRSHRYFPKRLIVGVLDYSNGNFNDHRMWGTGVQ